MAPYRDRPVRLLEIGVFAGGSLRLWREYFGESARILGIDPAPHPDAESNAGASGATLVRADAYDPATAAACGELDIVVDDGPHTLESQVAAIRLYAPRLRPGGMLVVEDVQDPSWFAELAAAVPAGHEHEPVDLRYVRGRWDDLMFVVRAPAAAAA